MSFVRIARGCASVLLAVGASPFALAQGEKDNPGYVERVTVTGSRLSAQNQPGTTTLVTSGDLQRRDVYRLSDVLTLTPGVSFQPGNRGGARNEASIYIRGFDLSRVPVLLDGVPIYVPYDGYIDLNRIQTFDLSAIEIARGYSSVMYGPNAMAGAINLVRRRPDDGFAATGAIRIDATSDLEHSGARATALASYGASDWYIQGGGWLARPGFHNLARRLRARPFPTKGRTAAFVLR
jgi:iron complex outermembrane receptor protein